MKIIKGIFLFFFLIVSSIACEKEKIDEYTYHIPEVLGNSWEVGSSDDVGISSVTLSKMMDQINTTSDHNIHNILIFKNEKLVFEEYFEGYLYSDNPPGANGDFIQYDMETDHFLASVSKSITSVLFGVAVKEGYIDNVDERVVDIFPEYKDILTDTKVEITIKQLLSMSSGLAWDESSTSYEDPTNDLRAMFDSDDPLAYVLSRPLLYPPGTQFLYNSGCTNVVGAVIEKYTGMSLLDFGKKYLFNPLNIKEVEWQRLSSDYYFASSGLFLSPRELAKIGSLFLNNGYWDENQIINPDWISESAQEQIITQGQIFPKTHAYGYYWWLEDFQINGHSYDSFFAAGWGDQYMFIFPKEDLMIVFNGGNYLSGGKISPFSLVTNYILPALQ